MRQRHTPVLLISAALLACAPAAPVTTTSTPSTLENRDELLGDADRARQALNRLTFGARPGDLAAVERMGLQRWVELQLHPERIADPVADSVLNLLDITHKSAFELVADHPQGNEVGLTLVQQASPRPDMAAMRPKAKTDSTPMAELASMRAEMTQANARATRIGDLGRARTGAIREFAPSLLLRATLSDRQLLEVMTAFWENHFSVSSDKMPNPFMLVDYDRTIRAHALGKFRDLLGAVATSPAMLYYLDNYQSTVDSLHPTAVEWRVEQRRVAHPPLGDSTLVRTVKRRRTGINENYARELMELHTLGVDGGYSQHDVQDVARCLTGWGVDNIQFGGSFAFQAAQHDAGEKVVLGIHLPGGRGIEDGQEVLDILARHPSTAHYIAHKLAVRLVSDNPPPALVDRVAQTYLRTDGDMREVIRAIVTAPEFNSRAAYRAKVKTPFELVASILRVMNATPDTTQESVQIVARLGQPIFGRSTPDGWPDQGTAWMNTGALLNRINLGVQVGANRIGNVSIATWKPASGLLAMSADKQVDGIIAALLSADASNETRKAMLAVQTPAGTLQHIGDLVGIAIGSSDFQKR